jgi:Spy/CpxP family protein refolding chaperone
VIPPRVRAGLVIAAIVLASGIAGAAIDRATLSRRPTRSREGPPRRPPGDQESRRREMLDNMSKELALTASQRAGLDSIFQRSDSSLRSIRREMQPRLQAVFESSRVEINARLDSTQRVKFASMRRPGGGGPGGGGPPRDRH